MPPPPGSRLGAEQRIFLVGSTRSTLTKMSTAGLIVIVAMSGIVAESAAFGSRLRAEFHSGITLKKKIGIFWPENTLRLAESFTKMPMESKERRAG
jgi:hypothetical protein